MYRCSLGLEGPGLRWLLPVTVDLFGEDASVPYVLPSLGLSSSLTHAR